MDSANALVISHVAYIFIIIAGICFIKIFRQDLIRIKNKLSK